MARASSILLLCAIAALNLGVIWPWADAGGSPCDSTVIGEWDSDDNYLTGLQPGEGLGWTWTFSGTDYATAPVGDSPLLYWPGDNRTTADSWACVEINHSPLSTAEYGVLLRADPWYTEDSGFDISGNAFPGYSIYFTNCDTDCDVYWQEANSGGTGTVTHDSDLNVLSPVPAAGDYFCAEVTGTGTGTTVSWWTVDAATYPDRCDHVGNEDDSGTFTTSTTPKSDSDTDAWAGVWGEGSAQIRGWKWGNGQTDSASDQGTAVSLDVRASWEAQAGAANVLLAEDWDNGANDIMDTDCNEESNQWDTTDTNFVCETDPRTTDSDQVLHCDNTTNCYTDNPSMMNFAASGTGTCFMMEFRSEDTTWGATEDMIRFVDSALAIIDPRFSTTSSEEIDSEQGAATMDCGPWTAGRWRHWMYQNNWDATEDETDNHRDTKCSSGVTNWEGPMSNGADAAQVEGIRLFDGQIGQWWLDNMVFYKGHGCPWFDN